VSGKQFDSQHGFPTPDDIPEEAGCRQFSIPANKDWFALLMGALLPLTISENWYKYGDLTEDEAAAKWQELIEVAYEAECGQPSEIDTPFWDDATDVDDRESVEEQPWYGYVEDAEAPPGELTFIEDASIWLFTGLLAVAVDVNLALAFNTIAPRFALAMRAGDIGEIIRIVVDGQEAARVDTTDRAGEIIRTNIIADPELETHQLYIMKVS